MNDSKKRDPRFRKLWKKRGALEEVLKIGDTVSFTLRAIVRGKNTDDIWDRLVGGVDPQDRFKVVGKDAFGNIHLEGWNVTCEDGDVPIVIGRRALNRVGP
jgi:hypothetical protein